MEVDVEKLRVRMLGQQSYAVKDLADYLEISEATIQRVRRDGLLTIELNGRVSRDSVLAWLKFDPLRNRPLKLVFVALISGRSQTTLKASIASQKLTAVKVGGSTRILQKELAAYLHRDLVDDLHSFCPFCKELSAGSQLSA